MCTADMNFENQAPAPAIRCTAFVMHTQLENRRGSQLRLLQAKRPEYSVRNIIRSSSRSANGRVDPVQAGATLPSIALQKSVPCIVEKISTTLRQAGCFLLVLLLLLLAIFFPTALLVSIHLLALAVVALVVFAATRPLTLMSHLCLLRRIHASKVVGHPHTGGKGIAGEEGV